MSIDNSSAQPGVFPSISGTPNNTLSSAVSQPPGSVVPTPTNSFAKMAKTSPSPIMDMTVPTPIQPVTPAPLIEEAAVIPSSNPFVEPVQTLPIISEDIPYIKPAIQTTSTPVAPVAPQQQVMNTPAVQTPLAQPPTTSAPTQANTVIAQATEETPRSIPKTLAKWGVTLALTVQGMKGLFDSLYFILVEFQNFEKALEEHRVETTLINQLILKAGLLVFTTALSVFFAMQLSTTNSKQTHWLKIIASIIVGITCFLVMYYANTIHVLDVLK